MKRLAFCLSLLSLSAHAAPGAPAERCEALPAVGAPTDWAPPTVKILELPNGMKIWHIRQTQTPLVSVQVVFPGGASTDPKGKEGLSALMTDLLDEGAGDRDALQLADALQDIATDYGVTVSTDGAVFSMDMLAEQLEASFALLSDIIVRPHLKAADFNRRRDQHVANAIKSEAQPGTARTLVMRRALFGDAYGGAPATGNRQSLASLTLADVKSHYEGTITPDGAVMIVVGDVTEFWLLRAVDQYFGRWHGTPSVKQKAATETAPIPAVYFIDFPGATQSSVAVARRAAGTDATDYFPASVFNQALGGSFTSRLNLNLREDKGWTYGARSAFYRWQRSGIFALMAQVKTDATTDAIREMFSELEAIGGKAEAPRVITAQERDEAVAGRLARFPSHFERISSTAARLTALRLDGRDPQWYQGWADSMRSVTAESANAAARQWSDPKQFVIIVAGDGAAILPTLETLQLPIHHYNARGERIPDVKPDPSETVPDTEHTAAQ